MFFDNLSSTPRRSNFVQKLALQLNTLKLEALGKVFTGGPVSVSKATESSLFNQRQGSLNIPIPSPETPEKLISDHNPGRSIQANSSSGGLPGKIHSKPGLPQGARNPEGPDFVARFTKQNRFRGTAPPRTLTEADLKNLNLRPGESFQAEALRPFDSKTLLVRLSRTSLLVHTDKPDAFGPGDIIRGTVQPNRHNFILTTAKRGTPSLAVTPNLIRSSFPQNQSLNDALLNLQGSLSVNAERGATGLNPTLIKNLQETLGDLLFSRNLSEGKTPSAYQIESTVERSGLNLEGRVKEMVLGSLKPGSEILFERDLKGQVLRLVEHLEKIIATEKLNPDQGPQIRELLSHLRQTNQTIEFQQLNHLLAKQENQPQLLPIPAQILGENEDLKIYVREESTNNKNGEGKAKKAIQLVFLLDMSLLGDIRVDGRVEQQTVSLEITAKSAAIVQWIESQASLLEGTLAQLGFETTLKATVREKVESDIPESFSEYLLKDASQLVDILT